MSRGVFARKLKTSSLLFAISIFFVSTCMPSFADTQQIKPISVREKLAALEASSGGRIGLSAINTANKTRIQYRAEERFPFQSTFKVIGVSAILRQSMTDSHLLQQSISSTVLTE